MSNDKYLDLVGKLMSQAEGAGTKAEADIFTKKAQSLASIHSVDLEVARQHQADKTRVKVPVKKTIPITQSGKMHQAAFVELFLKIAGANDITCDITHNSKSVIAFGFESDLEVVELLYASLVIQMVTSCQEFLASGEYRKEKVFMPKWVMVERWSPKYEEYRVMETQDGWVEKPVHGTVARASFYENFARQISMRLWEARREALMAVLDDEVEITNEAGEAEITTKALVLKVKDVVVHDFYKEASTAKGSWAGSSSTGYSNTSANAGRSAGKSARLSSQKEITA